MGRKKREFTQATKVFSERLSDLVDEKKANGLQQKDIASEIGVSSGSLSNWCSDGKTVSANNIIKIVKYFNVSADWLLGLSNATARNAEIQAIHNATGLWDDAISRLMVDKIVGDMEAAEFISYLLTCEQLPKLIQVIKQYNSFSNDIKAHIDIDGEDHETSMKALFKMIASDLFWEIVNEFAAKQGQIMLDHIASETY